MSGGCEPEAGRPTTLSNMPLRLMEQAIVTALDHMEATEEYLAACEPEVFRGPVERALLRQQVATVAEEVRTMRDRVAKLMGRMEAARERPADGRRIGTRDVLGLGEVAFRLCTRREWFKPWSRGNRWNTHPG